MWPPTPTLPSSPLHLGAMDSDQSTPFKCWGHLGILFIGVSQVLVQSLDCWGRAAVPEATGEQVCSGIKKSSWERLLCLGIGVVREVACTSQPKTLLAGPALGFSKTVSVPVRVRLNTEGAAAPACSVDRRGRRCAQGPSLAS